MKKLICLVLTCCMMVSLFSACGRNKEEPAPTDGNVSASDGRSPANSGDGTGASDGMGGSGGTAGGGSSPADGGSTFVDGFGLKYVDQKLTATGREKFTPETGPEGTWDIPVPFINPLGSQKLYTGGTTFDAKSSNTIQYVANFIENRKRLYGDLWYLNVNDVPGLPVDFLTDYAGKIGAEIYSSTYADRLIFKVRQPDAIWWCDATEKSGGFELRILKQKVFEVGKEYGFTGEELETVNNDEVAFITESTGEKFQTLRIGLPSGKVRIFATDDREFGDSTSMYRYDITLDSKTSKNFILDDLPQGAALYGWHIAVWNDQKPSGLTFKVEESYPLPTVKYGDDPGVLLVKGVPFGSVTAEPQRYVGIDIREANQRDLYGEQQGVEGILTPEGDTLFTMPAGLWTIVNNAPYMNYGSTRAQLIPVNSGEMTTVTLPDSLMSANTRLNSMADDAELTGGISVEDTKDKTSTAELSIAVSDPLERDIEPTIENTVIYEGATKVMVTDIRRVVAPCSVALVIDSSGSMKKDIKATLDAAKTFLQTLPEGSYVKIVDFDAKVNVLKGETPAAAITALAGITAGGATKLYDATLKGLESVKGKTRPAVVVFTDGIDSREDKTGNGSTSTREAVTTKIKEADIPVYTIGFGKRLNAAQAEKAEANPVDGVPDIQCLLEFATAAGGQYYPAKDPAALAGVFAAISSKLGNNFVLTYNRPEERNVSETPFISMVADNSGSMNTDPTEGKDCNYRMEKTIGLFHDFVAGVPDKAMMQFTTFQTPPMSPVLIVQQQITTDNKATILKSLGEMHANGGTPIVEVLRTAYENLLPVPSSRKAILFLTDSGLEVEKEQQQQYKDLLAKIKEKNITILFVGMGIQTPEKAKVFQEAAAATGGDYVISENVADLKAKLDKLLETLKITTASQRIPISVSIGWKTPAGEDLTYAVADEVEFAQPPKAGIPLEPDLVKISTGTPYERLDESVSAVVTGYGRPGTDNIVTHRLPFNKTLSNKAMQLTVKQAVYLSRFMGVDMDQYAKQFVALEVELENKTEKKIPYEIPSLFDHFYLGVNGEGLYPASKATWLAEKPLSPHGDPQITVNPGEKVSGVIVFVVPKTQGFTQQSLHFYDTGYGHIQLALAGKMADKWMELESLPTSAPASLSDTFSMKVTAQSLKPKVDIYAAGERSAFRVVEAQFESKVQALLNLEPKERIWLKVETQSGALMSRMSDATAALPFGFLEPVMLGPSSDNRVRMAFDLPVSLGQVKSSLWFDLATGKAEIPVTAGNAYGAPKAVASIEGPGMRVTVNQLVALNGAIPFKLPDGTTAQDFPNAIILDVTMTDLPGNEGTKIPGDFFALVNRNYKAPSGQVTAGRLGLGGGEENDGDLILPGQDTSDLVFGIGDDFGVFEGQSRRGVILFRKPGGNLADWTLQSKYMDTLTVPLTAGTFASPELLGRKSEALVDNTFEKDLSAAVAKAVNRYVSLRKDAGVVGSIGTPGSEDGREDVPMPSLSTYGLRAMAGISTEEQALALLQSLRCIPINRNPGYLQSYGYEPEAVVSQGWGDIADMTNLTMRLFSKLGFEPKIRPLMLTETGYKVLQEMTGVDANRAGTIPIGIQYRNAAGERKMVVVPFMMDLSGLSGLVYYPSEMQRGYWSDSPPEAIVSVAVRYIPGNETGSAAGNAGDAGSALGGGEGGDGVVERVLLKTNLSVRDLSTDALDLCFMPRQGTGGGTSYSATLSGPGGMTVGETVLENPKQVLGVRITVDQINGTDPSLVHYSTLGEGDTLQNFFQTLAINLPDVTEEAAMAIDEKAKQVHDASKNPDPLSIARWYGRNILYQFIIGQSMFDNQMVRDLGLVLGRLNRPRCMVVTSNLDKSGTMHTTLDLMQPWNEVHAGSEEAAQAYQLTAGFYLSTLEAEVLPGANKVGYLDLWNQAPEGTVIQAIPCLEEDRDDIWQKMIDENKYPQLLLERVKQNENLIFVPTAPTVFEGQKRWAWLEIDPERMQTISVFDTGLHAGMTEFKLSLLPTEDDTVKWLKGIWVGTNIAVWTMCSSSLKYGDNYKMVLADAKKTAMEVAKVVADFYGLMEQIQNKEAKFSTDFGAGHKIEFKISMSGIKGSFKQKLFSLSGGMKLAIDAYFKSIAPPPPSPSNPPGASK